MKSYGSMDFSKKTLTYLSPEGREKFYKGNRKQLRAQMRKVERLGAKQYYLGKGGQDDQASKERAN